MWTQVSRTPSRGPMRVLLGAFGDPGHAFPMIALGRALAARGHEVTLQTWTRWQRHIEDEGLAFAPATAVCHLARRASAADIASRWA